MARRTHPRTQRKHSREHARAQRRRWSEKRLRRARDSNGSYLSGYWGRTVKLEATRPKRPWSYLNGRDVSETLSAYLQSVDTEITRTRSELEQYGQRGPLYFLPTAVAMKLPRNVRKEIGLCEDFTALEQLHERANYGRYVYDYWEADVTNARKYIRARARRVWRREHEIFDASVENNNSVPEYPRRHRHRPASQCGSRRGRPHDWGDWVARNRYWNEEGSLEKSRCRRCQAARTRVSSQGSE